MRLKVGLFLNDLADRFCISVGHHNTWKCLVGISPNGAITFVSKLWSGRVSDKEITLQSGVLNLLEPGDNVMAERGFNIAELLPPGVSQNIPPFKGKQDQLTAEEAKETAHIAAVRIHAEGAIGRVKNYHILDGTVVTFICLLLYSFV